MDAKISFDIYLKEGIITKEQYDCDYKKYRNGIWQLTKDNFENYLQSDSVIVLKKDELKELMFQGFTLDEAARLYSVVENKLSYNEPISDSSQQSDFLKINQISSRLPLFYINFDTEVFDTGRVLLLENRRTRLLEISAIIKINKRYKS